MPPTKPVPPLRDPTDKWGLMYRIWQDIVRHPALLIAIIPLYFVIAGTAFAGWLAYRHIDIKILSRLPAIVEWQSSAETRFLSVSNSLQRLDGRFERLDGKFDDLEKRLKDRGLIMLPRPTISTASYETE